MKTQRMSRNTENRNARKGMIARGRASLSRSGLFAPDVILSGRAFRRANRLSRADVALLNVLIRQADGTTILPSVTVETDERTRMVAGSRLR